jgi:hypothetical protein
MRLEFFDHRSTQVGLPVQNDWLQAQLANESGDHFFLAVISVSQLRCT